MSKKLKIVMAQLNPIVGDINGNLKKFIDAAETARDQLNADMIVFPELGLMGYPAEDLLLRKSFVEAEQQALKEFTNKIDRIHCVVSHTHVNTQGLFNSCSLIFNGSILGRYAKQHLPNYGVFDEKRYFVPGSGPCVIPVNGIPVGLIICEDLWIPGAIQQAAVQGARIIVSPNASPFETNKHEQRVGILSKQAKENRVAIIYVNNYGGQDDIVFDGGSMAFNDEGEVCQFAGFFNENLLPVDIEVSTTKTSILPKDNFITPTVVERIYSALVLGVRDYIHKNKCKAVLIGVSGGIDSALTLAIAVDALGSENVKAVIMPSRYSSTISMEDGVAVAKNLNVTHEVISIEETYQAMLNSLKLKGETITEQNIQSRCRGMILMALANQTGHLVLTTGNRSELATGYCTLYGDMAGGFNVLKDIPKTLVYQLAKFRNQNKIVIPERTISRPPTAELAPNQSDLDSLPPYEILDPIIEFYINMQMSVDEIVAKGFDKEIVEKVVRLIRINEFKRRQAPLGPRINNTAFGKDRRYPVTNQFKI